MVLMSSMLIRVAQYDDADDLAAQNIALAEESEGIVLNHTIVLKGVHALLSDENKGLYLVAEQDNKIIGQLMITIEWSDWRNKPIWWVQSVYVQKEWRKKGVFTNLLDFTRKYAQKQGVAFLRLYVYKNNDQACQVYERMGWKKDLYKMYHLML